MLQKDPPPGAWCGPIEGKPLTELEAGIQGPAGTVYEAGVFKLSVDIPTRYPMEPPKVRFVTPVYHPNIDAEGRICLDILNPPPKGAWKPSLNISTVLSSIALLLSEPNPDDGLVTDTTYEYKHQREIFNSKAKAWTRQHAVQMKQGEAVPAAIEVISPRANDERQQERQQKQQQLDILEDEQPINTSSYPVTRALESASELPTQITMDVNKENGAARGAGKQKQFAEIEDPSLDTAVLQAEKDKEDINKAVADAEPPQKKSKLSLQRN